MSEELLKMLNDPEELYQNAPNGYLTILPDGSIVKINTVLLEWLGYTEDQIIGQKKFADFLSKGGNIHYEMFFRPMININGSVKELSYEFIRQDGSSFRALLNGKAMKNNEGQMLGINLSITDNTHRHLYEQELLKVKRITEAEKKRFELLADMTPEMIWTVDFNGRMNYLNRSLKQYFSLTTHELQLSTLFKMIDPRHRNILLRHWIANDNGVADFKANIRITKNGRDYEWFEMRIIPYNDVNYGIKWFGACASIDKHVRAMQRKDEFIHIASHELKTPVTILQAYLQLMQTANLSPEIKGYVSKSLSTLKSLQFLISSLLNVPAINSGKLALNFSTFSITQLLIDCVDEFKHSVRTHKIVLNIDEEECMVHADKERILQVVINLITNAIKYSPGASSVILQLKKEPQSHNVRFSVKDFGVGISETDQDKVFNRYYRVTEEQDISGLGLGLYIAQNIMVSHRSRIFLESRPGEGSVFHFSLPIL